MPIPHKATQTMDAVTQAICLVWVAWVRLLVHESTHCVCNMCGLKFIGCIVYTCGFAQALILCALNLSKVFISCVAYCPGFMWLHRPQLVPTLSIYPMWLCPWFCGFVRYIYLKCLSCPYLVWLTVHK